MSRTFVAVSVLMCAVGACEQHREVASRAVLSKAMRGVLAYPRSTLVSMTAGTDAGQMVFASPDAVDTVARWFRLALPMNGWQLHSDAKAADGTVSLYAQKGITPLWIALKRNVGVPGTTYTLIAAVTDSTKSDSGR